MATGQPNLRGTVRQQAATTFATVVSSNFPVAGKQYLSCAALWLMECGVSKPPGGCSTISLSPTAQLQVRLNDMVSCGDSAGVFFYPLKPETTLSNTRQTDKYHTQRRVPVARGQTAQNGLSQVAKGQSITDVPGQHDQYDAGLEGFPQVCRCGRVHHVCMSAWCVAVKPGRHQSQATRQAKTAAERAGGQFDKRTGVIGKTLPRTPARI